MLELCFVCPKCSKCFTIKGYWKWVLKNPFHTFTKRYTKCPHCNQRSWIGWVRIDRQW